MIFLFSGVVCLFSFLCVALAFLVNSTSLFLPFWTSDIFFNVSGEYFLLLFDAAIFAFDSAVCLNFFMRSEHFRLNSSDIFRPLCAKLFLSHCSGVRFFPLSAADNFARLSSENTLPIAAALILALYSGEAHLLLRSSLMRARVSAECLMPRQLPAVGDRLYHGFKASIHACSRGTQSSFNKTTSKTMNSKASSPCFWNEYKRRSFPCVLLRSAFRCVCHLSRKHIALPTYTLSSLFLFRIAYTPAPCGQSAIDEVNAKACFPSSVRIGLRLAIARYLVLWSRPAGVQPPAGHFRPFYHSHETETAGSIATGCSCSGGGLLQNARSGCLLPGDSGSRHPGALVVGGLGPPYGICSSGGFSSARRRIFGRRRPPLAGTSW